MSDTQDIYHLAMREVLATAGGRFITRDGWSLPADFGDAAREYTAIRTESAMIERSQYSRFMVTGTDAGVVLSSVFSGYVDELDEGRTMRTVALDETGNVRDIVLIARTGGIAYLVIGEPGQREETLARLNAAKQADFDVEIGDRTLTTCLLGMSGPTAAPTISQHLAEALPGNLRPMQCVAFQFHGFRSLAMRTSQTGEDGFELMLAPAVAQHVIETLRAVDVPLAGMEAQEMTRVEACIPSFAPDLLPGVTPGEADIEGLFGLPSTGDAPRLLSALLIEGAKTLPAGTILSSGGAEAGQLRSCVHSPTLDATIGLGIVDAAYTSPGQTLELGETRATVVAKPFLRRRTA